MALVVLALLLFMPLAGTATLEVAPAAVPWDSSTLLTVDSAEPLNAICLYFYSLVRSARCSRRTGPRGRA